MKKITIAGMMGLSLLIGGCETLDKIDQGVVGVIDGVDAVFKAFDSVRDTKHRITEELHLPQVMANDGDCFSSISKTGSFDNPSCQRSEEVQREHEEIKRERHRYDTLEDCQRKRGSYSYEECRKILGV